MKNNWKTKKCVLFFGMILVLSLATFYSFHINKSTNTEDAYNNNKINLKTAGYWDLTGTLILIDDSDITKNWSYTAATYDWCSGSGTWNDPYLIENVTIDGQDAGSCLKILHSKTAYFIIRNCTLFNSFTDSLHGNLLIDNVNNGLLTNNTCYDGRYGIYLDNNSDNNTIVENILRDNNVGGVFLWDGCGGNKIANNTLINNDYFGIHINYDSDGNNITNNIIKYNGWGTYNFDEMSGIFIQHSDGNIVSNNEITNNNRNAIYLYDDFTYDNVIINNNLSESKIGIRMSFNVLGSLITNNIIKDNINYGIIMDTFHPQGNQIYLNWFIDNGIQAYDSGHNNDWDNGTIGNFWSNYSGVDADDNGIGDTPYIIGGDSGGDQDNYPIWYDSPNIKILSPQPSEIFESSAPTFNVSIKDPNLEAMWYTLNNGMLKVLFTTNESVNQGLWDALSDGPNFITFYANDSVGNVNSSSVTVIKDTGAPNIHVNNPNLYDIFAFTAPAFNVEVSDYLLNTTWYTVNSGVTKYIFTANESLNTDAWNNALNGLISITFYANDTLGNLNSVSVSVYKDTLLPIISIIAPQTGAEFNTTAPNFIVEFGEANLVEMWYTINESLTKYTFTVNGTINQAAWNALPEGELILKFYIEDIAGNIASDEEYIIKKLPPSDGNGDTTTPEIDSYPLILLVTTIWFISTIILVRIKKNIEKK
ncbi:MAG: right-handed parallel beta-helix repeat-containing protein [Candidatus Lokiarchaeota archaeon]|nr:right-handed parallel beta-helix repeat-containing protein [Candidatus Lokiarchaeota archaeon]